MKTRRIVQLSPALDDVPAFEDVVYIRHGNMEPDIRLGDAVFLAPPGYTGMGIYSLNGAFGLALGRPHPADIRRVQDMGRGKVRITMDSGRRGAIRA